MKYKELYILHEQNHHKHRNEFIQKVIEIIFVLTLN